MARELTERETEVLTQLAQGLTSKQIGRALGIAPTTVDKHMEMILVKRGARNRIQLIANYFAERSYAENHQVV